MDYRSNAPRILKDFLTYHETIKGHSKATVDEYYLDLRNFFRFLKLERSLVKRDTDIEDIDISDIDLEFIKSIRIEELYRYQSFSPEMENSNQSLSAGC